MDKEPIVLTESLTANFPWYIIEVVKGVDVNNVHRDGFAEVGVDDKFQGKYMNICRIIDEPCFESMDCDTPPLLAEVGDLVCVWATAVESFKLFEYGSISLVRNADIFLKISAGTALYNKIMEENK